MNKIQEILAPNPPELTKTFPSDIRTKLCPFTLTQSHLFFLI